MRCLLCGESLFRKSFELFIENGMEETYGVYPCDNHCLNRNKDLPYRVEIVEESVPTRKPDTGYTRHRVCEETTTSCPECGKMLDHVSNDETILWDWILYHKRYVCSNTPKHVIRILIERRQRGSEAKT